MRDLRTAADDADVAGASTPRLSPAAIDDLLTARSARHRLDRGGPLIVSGGGATYVATDALRAYIEQLGRLVDALADAHHRTRVLAAEQRAIGGGPPVATAVATVLAPIERLDRQVGDLLEQVRGHRALVVQVARAYTRAESLALGMFRTLRGLAAVGVGALARIALPIIAASPSTWITVASAIAAWKLIPGTDAEKVAAIRRFIEQHPELYTNPEFVELVRGAAVDLDNVALGALLPPSLAALLADDTSGIAGVPTSGLVLMTLASPFGLFRDSELRVRRVSAGPLASVATGVAQRLERVPEGNQVRIEKYEAPGAPPRYVVFVAPTGTFSPLPTREPWDLQSNVAGVAGLPAASFRATEAAMKDAGITAQDQVQFVGFSQGGLVAGMLAASDHWRAVGLETTGAPTATLGIPGSMPGMDIRNSEDFIPALAGNQPPTDRLRVERAAFADGAPPTGVAVPGHQRSTYLETAKAVDQATSAAVRGQIGAMDSFASDSAARPGARLTVFTYHADRKW